MRASRERGFIPARRAARNLHAFVALCRIRAAEPVASAYALLPSYSFEDPTEMYALADKALAKADQLSHNRSESAGTRAYLGLMRGSGSSRKRHFERQSSPIRTTRMCARCTHSCSVRSVTLTPRGRRPALPRRSTRWRGRRGPARHSAPLARARRGRRA